MAQATAATTTAPIVPATGSSGAEAPKAPAAVPTPTEVRKLKLKLNGQDVELPESEVIERAQREAGSAMRFQEAANMRKQAEEVIAFAKSNPKEFFARTGMNARQWAEEYLIGELKAEQMSPEQRKAVENEEKLKKYESERKQKDDQDRQEALNRDRAKHMESYDKIFVEALGKSGLPKTKYTVKRMAELQLVNLKKKLDLDADQLAKIVREDYMEEQKSLFGAFDGDQLMTYLGPELVKKLSKAQIAKLKAKGVKTTGGTPPVKSGGKSLTWREYQLKNRGRA